jgi:hypothetical protein
MGIFTDRIHRLPRIWSNRELEKYAHLFHGRVVNVSGWKDIDKEGRHYRDYFKNASSYEITNYKSEARGLQGFENEIFLDLEKKLPEKLIANFDVVFNHTTLEHIYDIKTAFSNLCNMSKDIVIIILPFLQQYHSNYGDYWRFTPLAVKRMFEENGFELLYQSFNNNKLSSVYIFTIASRHPEKWRKYFEWSFSYIDPVCSCSEPYIGCQAIPNFGHRLGRLFNRLLKLPNKALK